MEEKKYHLIPGPPLTTGTYFAVIRSYVNGEDEMCVLHYQAHKGIYRAVGHAFNVEVKAEDVIGYVGEVWESSRQGAGWVKGAPKERKHYFGKVQSVLFDDKTYDAVIYPITDSDHWWAVGKDFKFSVHKDKIVAHLDESPAAAREEDAVEFAEWLNNNYISIESKDGKPVYVEYSPQEYDRKKQYRIEFLYDVFKQQKEK